MRVVVVLCKATRFFFKMIWIAAFTFILIACYLLLILYFLKGWNRLPEINTQHRSRRSVFISVVIPFRNEESNLMKLVEGLGRQRFSFHHLEVVMVDDHSADNGFQLLHELQRKHSWLRVESSSGYGKKAALRHGVSAATGELIVATDADCHFGRDWLQTISETYISQNPDMIIMPVGMEQGPGFLGAFQQNDYLALQMVTAGAAGCHIPVISSGANLAFKKKSYLETARKIPGEQYLSGDDVFLLHAFKAEGFKITYLKSAQAMVKTYPAPGWKAFLLQRMRWGGKSKGYTDNRAKLVALMILVTNSWLAILPFLAMIDVRIAFLLLGVLSIKIIVDRILLNQGKGFFAVPSGLFRFLVISLLYPPYILIAGVGSLFIRERWKDRTGK